MMMSTLATRFHIAALFVCYDFLRAADRQRGALSRAEQNVQAEGAKRLNGMSGHEPPAARALSGLGNVPGQCTRCRWRSVLRQRRRAKQEKRLAFTMPKREARRCIKPKGAFMMNDLTHTKMMTGSARGAETG
jgi:hypothetical protein